MSTVKVQGKEAVRGRAQRTVTPRYGVFLVTTTTTKTTTTKGDDDDTSSRVEKRKDVAKRRVEQDDDDDNDDKSIKQTKGKLKTNVVRLQSRS